MLRMRREFQLCIYELNDRTLRMSGNKGWHALNIVGMAFGDGPDIGGRQSRTAIAGSGPSRRTPDRQSRRSRHTLTAARVRPVMR